MGLDVMNCCGCFEMHVGNDVRIDNAVRDFRKQLMDCDVYGSSFVMIGDNYRDNGRPDREATLDRTPPFIIMTDRTHTRGGGRRVGVHQFIKIIKKLGMGEVWQSPVKKNDNTGYNIRMWVWQPDWRTTLRFMRYTVNMKTGEIIKPKVKTRTV